ncbi:MAG: YbhB/YbcL family Raf kinase inhibitor-like protein [Candidatus Kerfeldbacteria bacterium]|nr:YbhB/YbcL family Raf kinase inhibitor-like protein [Candidatus Kerfeldbacteria bacterium]
MQLISSAFFHQASIPPQYTCDGADLSPDLTWSNVPDDTQSFVLVVHDPDAPAGDWLHWLVINIPATTTTVLTGAVPTGGTEVVNDFGRSSWGGPCPPTGSHRYYFELYALNVPTITATTYADVMTAVQQYTLAKTELMGTYQRSQ